LKVASAEARGCKKKFTGHFARTAALIHVDEPAAGAMRMEAEISSEKVPNASGNWD